MIKMDKYQETIVLLLCLVAGCVYSRDSRAIPVPCKDYAVLNGTYLDVSFTKLVNNDSYVWYTIWYRYLETGQGSLAMTCPKHNECGTNNPMWMNDTIPSVSEGAQFVNICHKSGSDCCARNNSVRIANCGTFLVYLLPPDLLPERWCFDKSLTPLTSSDPDKKEEGANIGLIAGAACGGVVAVGVVVGVVLYILLKKMKANAVNASKPDSNSGETDKRPAEKQPN